MVATIVEAIGSSMQQVILHIQDSICNKHFDVAMGGAKIGCFDSHIPLTAIIEEDCRPRSREGLVIHGSLKE